MEAWLKTAKAKSEMFLNFPKIQHLCTLGCWLSFVIAIEEILIIYAKKQEIIRCCRNNVNCHMKMKCMSAQKLSFQLTGPYSFHKSRCQFLSNVDIEQKRTLGDKWARRICNEIDGLLPVNHLAEDCWDIAVARKTNEGSTQSLHTNETGKSMSFAWNSH